MPSLWTLSWLCLFWDSCLWNKECLCHEPKQEKKKEKVSGKNEQNIHFFFFIFFFFQIFENLEGTRKKKKFEQWSYWKSFPSSLHLQNKLIRTFWFIYLQWRDQENVPSSANFGLGHLMCQCCTTGGAESRFGASSYWYKTSDFSFFFPLKTKKKKRQ